MLFWVSCQFEERYDLAARLFAEATANDPAVANELVSECLLRSASGDTQPVGPVEDLATECRYPLARCAALAASGLGGDAIKIDAAERTQGTACGQAQAWLRADLAVWAKALENGSPAARALVRKSLAVARIDPDLAGMRARSEPRVEKMSGDERQECLTLWEAVRNLLKQAREGKPS